MGALRKSSRSLSHLLMSSCFVSIFLFFPRLISEVADWMCAMLLHMAWPQCEFRMPVWNVLHAAGWKWRT